MDDNRIEIIFEVMGNALKQAGFEILDGADDSSIIRDRKDDERYIIRVMQLPN